MYSTTQQRGDCRTAQDSKHRGPLLSTAPSVRWSYHPQPRPPACCSPPSPMANFIFREKKKKALSTQCPSWHCIFLPYRRRRRPLLILSLAGRAASEKKQAPRYIPTRRGRFLLIRLVLLVAAEVPKGKKRKTDKKQKSQQRRGRRGGNAGGDVFMISHAVVIKYYRPRIPTSSRERRVGSFSRDLALPTSSYPQVFSGTMRV